MQNKVIGVVAPKGSGKTTRVAKLVAVTQEVAIYDPMAETDIQYRLVSTHIVKQDLNEAHRVMAEPHFHLLYEPALPVQEGEEWYYPDFRQFIHKCWRRVQLVGPMTLIVDEAHYTMSKRTMPIEMWNIITNGRRYGLNIVWITQRFVGVNGWARANADEYWFFRLAHTADLQTVSEICGAEVMEKVRNLRRLDEKSGIAGEMLIWSSLDGSVVVEDQNKSSTSVPLSETDENTTMEESEEDPEHDHDGTREQPKRDSSSPTNGSK